jgi:hypothetical protein
MKTNLFVMILEHELTEKEIENVIIEIIMLTCSKGVSKTEIGPYVPQTQAPERQISN